MRGRCWAWSSDHCRHTVGRSLRRGLAGSGRGMRASGPDGGRSGSGSSPPVRRRCSRSGVWSRSPGSAGIGGNCMLTAGLPASSHPQKPFVLDPWLRARGRMPGSAAGVDERLQADQTSSSAGFVAVSISFRSPPRTTLPSPSCAMADCAAVIASWNVASQAQGAWVATCTASAQLVAPAPAPAPTAHAASFRCNG